MVLLEQTTREIVSCFVPLDNMSHSDWMRWCNLSHSVEPSALLTRLDVLSFTAVAAYTAAVAIAVFFLMRWFKLSVSSQHQMWAGLKL